MLVLTVKQPWAWAIAAGHKRVENRSWAPPPAVIGTRIAIHAGKARPTEELLRLVGAMVDQQEDAPLSLGEVLCTVRVDGVVANEVQLPETQRQWFFGPVGWVLSDVRRLARPIEAKGQLGLWRLEHRDLA